MARLTLEELEPRLAPGALGLLDGDDRRLKATLAAADVRARGPAPVAPPAQFFAAAQAGRPGGGGRADPALPPPPGASPPVVPVSVIERALLLFDAGPWLAVSLNTRVEDIHPEFAGRGARDGRTGRFVGFLAGAPAPRPPVTLTAPSSEGVPAADLADGAGE